MKARLTLAVAGVTLVAATVASAATIVNSKHDLSATTTTAGETTQICIFCHTPHNPVAQIPLWNRTGQNANTAFKLYTSSSTLDMYNKVSAGFKPSGFTTNSISLFCMSCHDGSPLGGGVHNHPSDAQGAFAADKRNSRGGGTGTYTGDAISGTAADLKTNFGTNLTKSHPVNIPYDSTLDANKAFWAASGALINGGGALTNGLPLFKATFGATTLLSVECSSCHAVHGSKAMGSSTNFLRTTMAGSKLCLGCHNK